MQVIVIGGGVIGLTSAYELARAGATVTIVDARATGRGASEVNAGWVCPAESGPVPAPGIVGQAARWMLRRDSPLYIRPSLEPAFISFLWRMARHCNTADYRAGMEALIRLSEGTMARIDAYRADGIDFEMHADGLLVAFLDPARWRAHQAHLDIAERSGLEPVVLDGRAARAEEPALSERVQGAIFFPHERHLDPAPFVRALHERCLELGVEIVQDTEVQRVELEGSRVVAVRGAERRFEGEAFLLAAGAWSGPLSRAFGAPLPIRPGKGYSLDLPAFGLRRPTYLTEAKVAATPLTGRLRLAGTMEFGRLEERVDPVRVEAIARAPGAFFDDWPVAEERRLGAGLRPMSPDGLPIIGRLDGLDNAYVSSGHAMLGLTLAPVSAAAISELILRGRQQPALAPFAAGRF
jgi:D-amino-acid dehydrogenase